MKLTTEILQAAQYEGEKRQSKSGKTRWTDYIIWDEATPSLGLRISHTGRKTFIVRYRADGRKRQKTLGTIQEITLVNARKQAIQLNTAHPPTADIPQPRVLEGPQRDLVSVMTNYSEKMKEA